MRRLAALLLLAAALTGAGCGARAPGAREDGARGAHEPSILDLDLEFVDQDGARVAVADLGGRPMVAAMIYTSCDAVCPRLTEDIKGLERALPERELRRIRFVLFSLDPGRDTPAALAAFARAHDLDPGRWRLLAADDDGVRDLAAALGVRHRREEDGEIAHSALIFAIDADGVVRHRQEGLGQDAAPLLAALERMR